MLTAIHAMIYSDDPAATRAFFADVLRWPFVSEGEAGDAGVGGAGTGGTDPSEWLIFRSGPSEVGVHPTSGVHRGREWTAPRQHEVSLMCDDLDATIVELRGRGAEFTGEPAELGFGRGVRLRVPGADDLLLYEPRHAVAHPLPPADQGGEHGRRSVPVPDSFGDGS
ncbi:MAG TPA: VOC family protein [Micropruina sp.]|nr:VOC family protein [Micropruina sp.]